MYLSKRKYNLFFLDQVESLIYFTYLLEYEMTKLYLRNELVLELLLLFYERIRSPFSAKLILLLTST
jgi:hypothetical protein